MEEDQTLGSLRSEAIESLLLLEQKRARIEQLLQEMYIVYPSWRTGANLPLDARSEYFMLLAVIVQNLRLSFIFVRDNLCKAGWWEKRGAEQFDAGVDERGYVEAVDGYMTMTRQYASTQIVSITEHALSLIATSGKEPFQLASTNDFRHAYEYVFKRVSLLGRYKPVLEIMRLVRNAMHSIGIYSDRNGDIELTYNGETYNFQLGQPLKWTNRDTTLMMGWICDAMEAVLKSPPVARLPHLREP